MRRRYCAAFCTMLAACVVYAQGIFLCPKCGYENERTALTCTHCQATIPAPKQQPEKKPASDSGTTFQKSGKLMFLSGAVAEKEIEQARKLMSETNDADVVRMLLRNAKALDLLTDPAIENQRLKTIQALKKQCDAVVPTSLIKCPVCDGSGKTMMKVVNMKGEISFIEVAGRPCPKCLGKGEVSRRAPADERKARQGPALKRFKELQEGRKYIDAGSGAWIPAELDQKLTARQTALVRRAVASDCPLCLGSGLGDCSMCSGVGQVKCPHPKCHRGMVEVFTDKLIVDAKIVRTENCKVCDTKGAVSCRQCEGKGATVCSKCGGTGDRTDCTKCGGRGVVSCKKCGGSGSAGEAVCPDCAGDGNILCTGCNGDGKAAK
ncbi:MAG: hypothetical protein C0404_07635 [Verrucomicrobia bacterium]|nr:hypothetical protein [Verrucomicrobiota bacterium]